jgi:hypothetical protein
MDVLPPEAATLLFRCAPAVPMPQFAARVRTTEENRQGPQRERRQRRFSRLSLGRISAVSCGDNSIAAPHESSTLIAEREGPPSSLKLGIAV